MLLFDHDLRYLMADGEELLGSIGFKPEAMVGHTLYEIASPQGFGRGRARLHRGALAGVTQTLEVPRGDKVYALTIVPVRDERDEVISGLALVYDVTSHKRGGSAGPQGSERSPLAVGQGRADPAVQSARVLAVGQRERLATAQRMVPTRAAVLRRFSMA